MKRFRKYISLIALLAIVTLIVTGCSTGNINNATPPHGGIYGWIYQWISLPLQNVMLQTARTIGGQDGAGWAIVIITLVVRLILLPLMLSQQKKSVTQQEKMARLQPQMKLIQQGMKHKPMTPEQQMQLTTWQRELYSKNNMSMTGGIGCLPLIIQMPIMIGIYQAVAYSAVLRHATFFGISLSNKSVVLAIVATLFAVAQSYISLIGVPPEQKKTMQSMMFLNPIMTLFFSLSFSGALALYWAAGNLVTVVQQVIVTFWITPREKKRIATELKDKPVQEVVTQKKIDDLFSAASTNGKGDNHTQALHQNLRNRNKGKQQRRK
ncbi:MULTISPECIES: membrane protein insertase YidC [Lactobacillus]|uniref:Membrane protein insertase YidC n=1 Tax=Lactobacillus xujianguonis TaxID=2495899 RepID=A0A437ST27_9LACO|nr:MULTISPECIES: membrane protein insertase YidC [Lactobacillus]RVU70058.1 membrane protein insertase YidC [Lactobacillus xujianguonis]RVU77637.1 membrane protein insertase YidC [Lactobacillus xujianguonis]